MPPPSDIYEPATSGEQMPPPSNIYEPASSAEQMPPPTSICVPSSSGEHMPPPSNSMGGAIPPQVPPPAPKQYKPERVNSIQSDTAPPVFMEHDFSFGSIKLSDQEQQKLMREGNPPPVDGGLEPVGLSFGSMMSLDKGMSFGTLDKGMSFGSTLNKVLPPDLQDIGTSFGSMSISTNVEKTMPGVATMVRHVMGDLLDCSDTDDEEEDPERKSKEWEKLQAAIANQDARNGGSRQSSGLVMPPPGGPSPYYPANNNQYSDYGAVPPPQMKKEDDWVDGDDQPYQQNEPYRLAQQTFQD